MRAPTSTAAAPRDRGPALTAGMRSGRKSWQLARRVALTTGLLTTGLLTACFLCVVPCRSLQAAPVTDLGAAPMVPAPAMLDGIGVDEHTNLELPLDAPFRDDQGRNVTLKDYCRGQRPLLLSLNYSNCPQLCGTQLTGIVDVLRQIEWTPGKDFDVVSVSLDPLESTTTAAVTKQKYLNLYGKAGVGDGWHMLTGPMSSITRVAQAVGVRYKYDAMKNQYSHPAVFVLVTPQGRISHYMYGIEFSPRTMRLSLVEASRGTIGSVFDRVLLLCYHLDPNQGKYTLQAQRVMSIGGLLTVAVLGLFIGGYLRREQRLKTGSGGGASTGGDSLAGLAAAGPHGDSRHGDSRHGDSRHGDSQLSGGQPGAVTAG